MTKKKKKKKENLQAALAGPVWSFWAPVVTFAAVFLYCYTFISQGLDVTDGGINLTQQMGLWHGWPEYRFGMLWFSDLMGALGQQVFDSLGLLGARIAWCLLAAATAAVTCGFLLLVASPLFSVIAAILTAMALLPTSIMIINYNNLTGLLLAGAAMVLALEAKSQGTDKKKNLLAISYALLVSLAFMGRFPAIVAVVVFPLLRPLTIVLSMQRPSAEVWKSVRRQYFWTCVSLVVLYLLIFVTGYMERYIYEIQFMFGLVEGYKKLAHYQTGNLINIYLNNFKAGIGVAAVFWGSVMTVLVVVQRLFKGKSFIEVAFVSLFLGAAGSVAFHHLTESSWVNYRYFLGATGIVVPLVTLGLTYFKMSQVGGVGKDASRLYHLVLAFSFTVVAVGGSSNGLLNVMYGYWLALPLTCLYLTRDLGNNSAAGKILTLQQGLALSIVAVVAWKAYSTKVPYRDYPNYKLLTEEVDHPRLKGIKTTPGRAKSFGELVKNVDRLVEANELMFAYNGLPMLHFLTKTRPYLGHPWPTLRGPQALEFMFANPTSSELPKVVVKSKTDTQHPMWGNGQLVPFGNPIVRASGQYIDQWVTKSGYGRVWENSDFVIYTRGGKK